MDEIVGVVTGVGAATGNEESAGGLPPLAAGIRRHAPRFFSRVILSPPASLEDVATFSSVILVIVPFTDAHATLAALCGRVAKGACLVLDSSAISLKAMRALVGPGPALFRVVAVVGNEPGEGAAALAAEAGTEDEAVERVKASLGWFGPVEVVSEEMLDALDVVARGAPAFLSAALEGMQEGAMREGLPPDTARPFTFQTALATALLLRDHPGSPADLKDQVASPGGTTIAGLATLEAAAVRGAFIRAVQESAAGVRARRDAAGSGVIE